MNLDLIEKRIKHLIFQKKLSLITCIFSGALLVIGDLYCATYVLSAMGIFTIIAGIIGRIFMNKEIKKWIALKESVEKDS